METLRNGIVQRGGDPNNVKGFQNLTEEQLRVENIRMLPALARDLAPHFLTKTWMLYGATNKSSFYISDNPIALQNTMNQNPVMGTLGLGVPGIEIYFPLSATLCLGFLCPTIEQLIRGNHARARQMGAPISFDHWITALDGDQPLRLDADNVTNLNSLQVIYAERYVFSANNDFKLLHEMLDSDERLKGGPRFQTA
jgi:Protein of unknown function (DUF4238)